MHLKKKIKNLNAFEGLDWFFFPPHTCWVECCRLATSKLLFKFMQDESVEEFRSWATLL